MLRVDLLEPAFILLLNLVGLLITWGDNFSDLEPDSAHLDQISSFQLVAVHVKFGLIGLLHHLPNLLLRLNLEHLIVLVVNELLLINPIGALPVQSSQDNLTLLLIF